MHQTAQAVWQRLAKASSWMCSMYGACQMRGATPAAHQSAGHTVQTSPPALLCQKHVSGEAHLVACACERLHLAAPLLPKCPKAMH